MPAGFPRTLTVPSAATSAGFQDRGFSSAGIHIEPLGCSRRFCFGSSSRKERVRRQRFPQSFLEHLSGGSVPVLRNGGTLSVDAPPHSDGLHAAPQPIPLSPSQRFIPTACLRNGSPEARAEALPTEHRGSVCAGRGSLPLSFLSGEVCSPDRERPRHRVLSARRLCRPKGKNIQ